MYNVQCIDDSKHKHLRWTLLTTCVRWSSEELFAWLLRKYGAETRLCKFGSILSQLADLVSFITSKMLNGTNRRHDTWRCMLHKWGKCWNTQRHTHTQVKPEIPRGLLSALHTWRLLISGCCLTPFNRIPLVLGFLCSVEDAHAISPGWVGEREREREKSREWKVRLQWQ